MSQSVHATDTPPLASVSAAWTLPQQPEIDEISQLRGFESSEGCQSVPEDDEFAMPSKELSFGPMASTTTVRTRRSVRGSSVSGASNTRIQHLSRANTVNNAGEAQAERRQKLRTQLSEALQFGPKLDDNHAAAADAILLKLRKVLDSKAFTAVSMICLAAALFGGSLFVLCDVPDDPGTVLSDTLMCLVTMFFILEITLLFIAGNGYRFSFFFWMDILGTLSMVFEISFLLGTAGKMRVEDADINPVLLRSARAAKIGARAARLSKVVKCLNFSAFGRNNVFKRESGMSLTAANGRKIEAPPCNAQVLKQRLGHSLSSKVSMLTVVLVIATPLFSIGRHPEEDFSMKGWSRTLELDYSRAWSVLEANSSLSSTHFFGTTLDSMNVFYAENSYFPYTMEGFNEQVVVNGRSASIYGNSRLNGVVPNRKQDIVRQEVHSCLVQRVGCSGGAKAYIYFDFQTPNRTEAGLDMGVIVFIVLCMVIESFDLSRTVDSMVVKPVENMLGTVQMMAKILNAVRPSGADHLDPVRSEDFSTVIDVKGNREVVLNQTGLSEAEMLEVIFSKFSFLVNKLMTQSQDEEMDLQAAAVDDESKGVIMEVMGLYDKKEDHLLVSMPQFAETHGKVVPELPVDEEIMNSWRLDVWSMSTENQSNVARYFFFDHEDSTGNLWAEIPVFFKFQELVRLKYVETNPYHNYTHACDVTAAVFRVLTRFGCREWLSDIDIYALLISALCHDVSHPGWTTPFLVETRHELAVRYNDSSPLENMHCARLFEICNHEGADAFQKFEKDAFRQARKVCINSILHTDNAQHFEMVKAVKDVYEMSSDICDAQANESSGFMDSYATEVLHKYTPLWHQLILHMCDVSNPLRPWQISRSLATRVQDEFFRQGDEEKKLGIPVGMLNDREKVSRSGAEHGFINFLVSPLVLATVSVFPVSQPLAVQMVDNLKEWRNLWVQDTKPFAEDIKKRDGDVQKVQEQVEKLGNRKPLSTVRNTPTTFEEGSPIPPTRKVSAKNV